MRKNLVVIYNVHVNKRIVVSDDVYPQPDNKTYLTTVVTQTKLSSCGNQEKNPDVWFNVFTSTGNALKSQDELRVLQFVLAHDMLNF